MQRSFPVYLAILFNALVLLSTSFSKPAQAELLGLVPGRTARIQNHATLSIEAGASWFTDQVQWSALRINFKPSQKLILYFDVANLRATNLPVSASTQTDFRGTGFGGGIIFDVPERFLSFDVAFKGAYHASEIDNDSTSSPLSTGGMSLQQSQLNADFIFSPIDPLFVNGLSWYGSIGYVTTSAQTNFNDSLLAGSEPIRYRDINGLSLGAGLVKPVSFGTIYAGAKWLRSDPLLGVGVRYSF